MEFSRQNTGMDWHFLLKEIFSTQGLNLCLLHCKKILYHWATKEALISRVHIFSVTYQANIDLDHLAEVVLLLFHSPFSYHTSEESHYVSWSAELYSTYLRLDYVLKLFGIFRHERYVPDCLPASLIPSFLLPSLLPSFLLSQLFISVWTNGYSYSGW